MPPPDRHEPDRKARFRELLLHSHPRWVGIARAYAGPSDRDDLLQEIALQVWKSLPDFRGSSTIETWAYRVALNTALAWKRKATTRAGSLKRTAHDVAELPGSANDGSDVAAVLDHFLSALSKADRAVMLLHLDGLTNSQAAEVLGVSENAHRTRLHRVRQRFEATYCHGEGER